MVRDVYAADEADPVEPHERVVAIFEVLGDRDPFVLLRVAQQLAIANVSPTRCQLTALDRNAVKIEVILPGITAPQGDLIRRKLQQLSVVDRVSVTTSPGDEE